VIKLEVFKTKGNIKFKISELDVQVNEIFIEFLLKVTMSTDVCILNSVYFVFFEKIYFLEKKSEIKFVN
jgi:hypothetical protein